MASSKSKARNKGKRPSQPKQAARWRVLSSFKYDGDPVYEAEIRRRGSAIEDLLEVSDDIGARQIAPTGSVPWVVLTQLAHAAKTCRALCVLAMCGYGPQGIVLARAIFEAAIAAGWALAHPDIADEQMDLHYRLAVTIDNETWQQSGVARYDNRLSDPLTQEERQRAIQLFGRRATKSWTGHSKIGDLVDEIVQSLSNPAEQAVILSVFQLMVTEADRLAHSSGVSNMRGLERAELDTQIALYSAGPSRTDIERCLQMGGTCLSILLALTIPTLAPELEDKLTAAQARLWRAWKDVDALASVSATDVCLCDRPIGTWADCHGYTDGHADVRAEARVRAAHRRDRQP